MLLLYISQTARVIRDVGGVQLGEDLFLMPTLPEGDMAGDQMAPSCSALLMDDLNLEGPDPLQPHHLYDMCAPPCATQSWTTTSSAAPHSLHITLHAATYGAVTHVADEAST